MIIQYLLVAVVAFFCESIDSSLGMGYGTILTPVLLLLGFEPVEIVPLILFSEFITGVLAAAMHHRKGNVNFTRESRQSKVALLLIVCSTVGAIGAVNLSLAVPRIYIKGYIAFLLLAIGISNLITVKTDRNFSWKRISIIGLLGSFNKGISGGGYGPLITGGQIISGVKSKGAIAITSLTEGLTCLVAIITYLAAAPGNYNWPLAIALLTGAISSVPVSVNIISILKEKYIKTMVTYSVLTLGTVIFIKNFSHLATLSNLPLVAASSMLTLPFAYRWGKRNSTPDNATKKQKNRPGTEQASLD